MPSLSTGCGICGTVSVDDAAAAAVSGLVDDAAAAAVAGLDAYEN